MPQLEGSNSYQELGIDKHGIKPCLYIPPLMSSLILVVSKGLVQNTRLWLLGVGSASWEEYKWEWRSSHSRGTWPKQDLQMPKLVQPCVGWSFRCLRWVASTIRLNRLFPSLEKAFKENTGVSSHFTPKLSQLQRGINVLLIVVCDRSQCHGN